MNAYACIHAIISCIRVERMDFSEYLIKYTHLKGGLFVLRILICDDHDVFTRKLRTDIRDLLLETKADIRAFTALEDIPESVL